MASRRLSFDSSDDDQQIVPIIEVPPEPKPRPIIKRSINPSTSSSTSHGGRNVRFAREQPKLHAERSVPQTVSKQQRTQQSGKQNTAKTRTRVFYNQKMRLIQEQQRKKRQQMQQQKQKQQRSSNLMQRVAAPFGSNEETRNSDTEDVDREGVKVEPGENQLQVVVQAVGEEKKISSEEFFESGAQTYGGPIICFAALVLPPSPENTSSSENEDDGDDFGLSRLFETNVSV